MTKTDRYLKIVKWARKRYRNADGSVTVSYGGDRLLSAYTAIESKAWNRYMGAIADAGASASQTKTGASS